MIRTIPLQVHAPRRPHAIPTRRQKRTRMLGAFVAALGAALLCAALVGYGIARAAAPARLPSGQSTGTVAAPALADGKEAGELRAAVRALPAFPDPYPAAAGMAP
ncbi:hypothetical protein ACEN8I_05685 [Polaromonas sp. CT11-55]|uniref:hypothetical protein n=1 Tax=Polaromonas sp. CT11-55 TaxID=3243045 RepID=UPI0039A41749